MYYGEIDEHGMACGNGVLTNQKYSAYTFRGTFLNDKMEGIGKNQKVSNASVFSCKRFQRLEIRS